MKPKCLILGSDYTGELNARKGIAEWLNADAIVFSIEEAEKAVKNGSVKPEIEDCDLILGGTGEETTRLVLDLGKLLNNAITVFLASILPDDLPSDIHRYDLIVAPPHKQLSGENVLSLLGVPHRLRPEQFQSHSPGKSNLLVGLLLGGNTRYCNGFTTEYAHRLGLRLKQQAEQWGARYLITDSRRTPQDAVAVIREMLSDLEVSYLRWQDSNLQAYMQVLKDADGIICTGDSLSMACESAITGKPVCITTDDEAMEIYHLRTIRGLIEGGYAVEFTGRMDQFPKPGRVLNPTATVGRVLLKKIRNSVPS